MFVPSVGTASGLHLGRRELRRKESRAGPVGEFEGTVTVVAVVVRMFPPESAPPPEGGEGGNG